MSAKLIAYEGTDGSGKTTALKYATQQLCDQGFKVLETREVGNPHVPSCVKLREFVLDPSNNLTGEAMEFIFIAMMMENVKFYESVKEDYDFIISDRHWFSHLAYTDHNVNEKFTKEIYQKSIQQFTKLPDITLFFDVNTETALKRRVKRGEAMDVIEMKGVEFQEKVRKSFMKYLEPYDGGRVYVVDANASLEQVYKQLDIILQKITAGNL